MKINFPTDDQIEEALKKIAEKEASEGYSYIIPRSAPTPERFKYLLCKQIMKYKHRHNLSNTELSVVLKITQPRVSEILKGKVHLYGLGKLIDLITILSTTDKDLKKKLDQTLKIFEA
jgi:predicted XRE-type DNA-binding protein